MTTSISYTLIHEACKKPMRVEWKTWYKVWVCTNCWKRICLDNIDNPKIINWLLMI